MNDIELNCLDHFLDQEWQYKLHSKSAPEILLTFRFRHIHHKYIFIFQIGQYSSWFTRGFTKKYRV